MQRQRGELVPIGDVLAGLGGPMKSIRETTPQARRGFTVADQVDRLVSASEADASLGFMARTMALCSLPRSNPGNRKEYKRVDGPFTLYMVAGGGNKLPYGNLPPVRLAPGQGQRKPNCPELPHQGSARVEEDQAGLAGSEPPPTLRYGPTGDSAPLRCGSRRLVWPKGSLRPGKHGPNAPVWGVVRCYRTISNEIQNHWLICIPLFLVNSHLFGSARSSPGREAAKRTLDGEDRSGIIQGEGKGGGCRRDWRSGAFSSAPGGCSKPSRRDKYRR